MSVCFLSKVYNPFKFDPEAKDGQEMNSYDECMYIYIYMFIYRERERETER